MKAPRPNESISLLVLAGEYLVSRSSRLPPRKDALLSTELEAVLDATVPRFKCQEYLTKFRIAIRISQMKC